MTLPNFLIVGAAKSGTTALYRYLLQHPAIFMPTGIKETFFFSSINKDTYKHPRSVYAMDAVETLEGYEALFSGADVCQARGEACVAYLYFHEKSIPRIRQVLGTGCKFIITLRHPVERAFSNYLHHSRDGLENVSFESALAQEEGREQQEWWWGFQYKKMSMYCSQVEAYLDAFGENNVKIVLYEDISTKPVETLQDIFAFLGVHRDFVPDTSRRFNVSGIPKNKLLHGLLNRPNILRSVLQAVVPVTWRRKIRGSQMVSGINQQNLAKPKMDAETRAVLLKYFEKDIDRLASLIGRDLSAWHV